MVALISLHFILGISLVKVVVVMNGTWNSIFPRDYKPTHNTYKRSS